ncbi:MAG TPA: Flp family type IVb pilin [Methyloceanibacter sp.]|jgi:pilus assembly protein Flp/PilA|nr:Flp family type IVb pilin [Methyloceanibacter sp.]
MRTMLACFLRDESGSTTIEYTLIAAGIAIAILTALNALGGSLGGLFDTLDGSAGGG